MSKEKLSESILEKLEKRQVSPKPRWQFLLKNYLLWIIGIGALVVGGLASSVVIFILTNHQWELARIVAGSVPRGFVFSLPYLWVGLLVGFVALADYQLKHTKRGYRWSLSTMVLASIVISIVLGVVFYGIGAGERVERFAVERAPRLERHLAPHSHLLAAPEAGIVAGKVISQSTEHGFLGAQSGYSLVIMDFKGKEWIVYIEAVVPPLESLENKRIVAVGKVLSESMFAAEEIRPLHPRARRAPKFQKKRGERKFAPQRSTK